MGLHCGVDIIEIDRVKKAVDSGGKAFKDRVFTEREIMYCEARKAAKYQSYAARFAAKEAVSKAFGTGISAGFLLKDIEVVNDESGRPCVVLHGKAQEMFEQVKGRSIALSLSHCRSHAVAYSILEVSE